MSIIYYQRPGIIELDGIRYPAYSGFGQGKNNPAMERLQNVGPIPAIDWIISRWEDHWEDKGPQVAILRPFVSDAAYNRSGFLIHGDSASHPGEASHGCIIAARNVRDRLRMSGELHLTVLHDFPKGRAMA